MKLNRLVKGVVIVGAFLATLNQGWAGEDHLLLENSRVAVEIDRQSGGLYSIRDKQQNVVYSQTGIGFEVVTAAGNVRSEEASAVSNQAGHVELRFGGGGLDITLHYRLGDDDHFIEKWLTIKASNGEPYFLKSVVMEDMNTSAFSEIHFHDDNTIWHCPINLFLRGDKGGCFAGLEYPYWDLKQKGKEGFRLGYEPNYQVAKGEVNVSEKYFIGVYRKEGIHRVSQGPYPGRGRCKWLNWGGKAGLVQHFKGRRIPPEVKDVPLEILDWGEVWAMQEFMRHVLPDDLPLPEDGFWIWQNGWWAGLWKIEPGILDLLKQAGIHDVMTAHTWYGRGNHPISPPYIDQMRTKPMGFPNDSGIAGLPGPAGPAAGLHANHAEAKLDSFSPGEFTPEFIMPPGMAALYEHGQKIGVHVSSFSLPCLYFKEHPEWASIDENGNVSEYLFGRKTSCPACDPYMEHSLETLDHVMTKYRPRWWGFDGRWLSYWEVPYYRPGPKGLGFDTCHAKNHGHLPGDNLYKEWKNIQAFVREIRRRHPKMCLEQYLGLKRGGPWALRYFNCDDNYYETNGALMNRFQTWHNQNDRFRPVYKNYAAIFGGSPAAFRTSVISSISATSYCQIGPGYKDLALEENRVFLKKWRAWATENYDYLKVKRDLFDSPGDSPVDGSAHIIKDRGFLFLFSVGGTSVRASIPLNRWLQLDENPDALYQVKEVYPREGTDLGVYQYGDEFLYDMPKGSAVIISVEPAAKGSEPRRPALQSQPVVVPAFSSVGPAKPSPAKARKANSWHWPFDELTENGAATPDASPNKAHARLSGQELCEGVVGKALQFKAGSKGVVVGDLGFQAPATVSFWLKSNGAQADGRIFSQLEGPTTQTGCLRLVGGELQIWNTKGWPVVVSGLSDKGIWQHVAVVYKEDGTVTGYLNGKQAQSANSTFDFKGVKAGIGARFLGEWGTPFIGALDDFRIYNSALGEKEIETICPPELFSKSEAAATKVSAAKVPEVKASKADAIPGQNLPRVLLLGDSISLGYEQSVRKLLAGKASVHHPAENCQSTGHGLARVDQWLGDEPWDVIHFNWGIWDAHYLKGGQLRTSAEQYEQNLRKLVSRLKATGAKLVWASTTPVNDLHQNGISLKGADIAVRNAVARKVMEENAISIVDLYGKMLPHIGRLQSDDGCHFTPEGYDFLAQHVVDSVLKTNKGQGNLIVNGTDWVDTNGNPIAAHEGDIARFDGVFYWYGSSYANNPKGKFGIAVGPVWNGVQVYRSTDLKNWEYRGVCLPRPKNGWGELGSTGRSHVIYNEKTKKYVMWYRWYLHVPASFLMVAVADHPEGPFTSLGPREMGTSNGFASDMNVFKDADGKAYVIYCDHGEHGVQGGKSTYAIRIDSLSDDYLNSNKDGVVVFDKGCEAPAMIKHKGRYIAVASGVHGWAGTETVCAVADSPLGKYKRQEDVSEKKTWSSQVTDLIYLKESDTVMALCDQWWIPDKSDINKSRYLFLPLHLDSKTGKAKMKYHGEWNPLSQPK